MPHLPLLCWHQLGSVASLLVLICKENASCSRAGLAALLTGHAGTVQMFALHEGLAMQVRAAPAQELPRLEVSSLVAL